MQPARLILRLVFAGFAVFAASAAGAACALSGTTTSPSVVVTYDPFSPAQTVLDFSVRLRNTGDDGCLARLYLRPTNGRQSLESAGGFLDFRLDGQDGAGSGQAGEIGPFVVQVLAGQSADIAVRATLAPQQIVPRGIYGNELTLRAEDEQGNAVNLAGGTVRLQANTLARTEMSISGSTQGSLSAAGLAPASINFGEARSGQTERVFVNVWSNGPVSVTLASENDGVLRLIGNPTLTPIPYKARFDGSDVSFAAPVTVVRSPPMALSGASYELALTLGDVARNFAGLYRDVVTVTVNQN